MFSPPPGRLVFTAMAIFCSFIPGFQVSQGAEINLKLSFKSCASSMNLQTPSSFNHMPTGHAYHSIHLEAVIATSPEVDDDTPR
ncbi:hypothetical protein BKA70DRAFT_1306473 [Coprinopsis sp. MPI-PUGE-AT-0042]|nr:hypothetical protein BKA70DRAFT_1319002 [Coprinopsis sp. MPI-PUGE-AT-0042]KAH6902329.1 hypothetical protein BKA70DRAFT_1306473 [Coprinopsis sp. MPI-PUGE-AT-0042]